MIQVKACITGLPVRGVRFGVVYVFLVLEVFDIESVLSLHVSPSKDTNCQSCATPNGRRQGRASGGRVGAVGAVGAVGGGWEGGGGRGCGSCGSCCVPGWRPRRSGAPIRAHKCISFNNISNTSRHKYFYGKQPHNIKGNNRVKKGHVVEGVIDHMSYYYTPLPRRDRPHVLLLYAFTSA